MADAADILFQVGAQLQPGIYNIVNHRQSEILLEMLVVLPDVLQYLVAASSGGGAARSTAECQIPLAMLVVLPDQLQHLIYC
jgi:hypothetical protein